MKSERNAWKAQRTKNGKRKGKEVNGYVVFLLFFLFVQLKSRALFIRLYFNWIRERETYNYNPMVKYQEQQYD